MQMIVLGWLKKKPEPGTKHLNTSLRVEIQIWSGSKLWQWLKWGSPPSHRILKWFGLEDTLKIVEFHPLGLMQEGGWTTSSASVCAGKQISPSAGCRGRCCGLMGARCFVRQGMRSMPRSVPGSHLDTPSRKDAHWKLV